MVHLLHHFSPLRNRLPHAGRIEWLAWSLIAVIASYAVFIPYSRTQSGQWQHWFWQLHTLVFAGTILILVTTLLRLPAWQSRRFYLVCGALIVAHSLTMLAAIVGIWWYDSAAGGPLLTWNFVFYLVIYTTHTFGLMYGVPLHSLPRVPVVRLATETLLVFVLTDVVLRVLLPSLIPAWRWTPGTQALELRLVNSIGVSFWYVRVYHHFAAFRGRFIVAWGGGLLAMLCTDVLFLLGTLFSLHGDDGGLFALAMPFWDLHQVLWALGLFWASQTPLHWRTDVERTDTTSKPAWWIVVRQSVLLVVLVLISSGVVSSPLSLFWLIAALVMHESLGMYEREQLIAAQQQTQAELQAVNRQLAASMLQIEELATVQERTRIARELHDGVCRALNAATMQLALCDRLIEHDSPRARQELALVQHLVTDGLSEARQAISTLRDTSTLDQPLPEVIQPLIDDIRADGINAALEIEGAPRMLDRQSTWALFRVVQEGLTNIRKHAHATHVSITLNFKPASVRLVVRDNGRGTTSIDGGMGIVGMRERVQSLGGTFRLYTAPDEGFVIDVEVPI